MSAKTIWVDESEIKSDKGTFWVIGQLIVDCKAEFSFLGSLREARIRAKTWNALHANKFSKVEDRKWKLLEEWVKVFLDNNDCLFHIFVFEENKVWKKRYKSPHKYWSNQAFLSLADKMRQSNSKTVSDMLCNVEALSIIMDRRSTVTGLFDSSTESISRTNDLESIYEKRIKRVLLERSRKESEEIKRFSFRLSFVNSSCFDAIQLCDCLTYMTRKRFLFENNIQDTCENTDFLDLWNRSFLDPPKVNELNDFSYNEKINFSKMLGN